MATAWVVTLPAVGVVGFVVFQLTRLVDPWGLLASILMVLVLLTWAYRLMRNSQNAADIEAMLPTDAELHDVHPSGHPDLHGFQGPVHINHHDPRTTAATSPPSPNG